MPGSSLARIWSYLSKVAAWVFEHYVAVAGLAAVLATLFYGLAYAEIYESVAVEPEQVGYTPTKILTNAVVGGIALLILTSLAAFLVFIPLIPIRDDPGAASTSGSWWRFIGNAALTACGILLTFGLGELVDAPLGLLITLSVSTLLFLSLGAFRPRGSGWAVRIEPRPLRFVLDRYLIALAAIGFPVGLLFTVLVTFTQAERLGGRISLGEVVRGSEIAGMPFLGIRAEPAIVTWKDGAPAGADIPRCVTYLGSADGTSVLYDRRSSSTFHVPAADIAIESRPDISSCDGPVNIRRPSIRVGRDGTLVCRRGAWESFLFPKFRFEWIARGIPMPALGEGRYGPRADRSTLSIWKVTPVHCRVTATSHYGKDSAVSDTLLLGRDGRLLR